MSRGPSSSNRNPRRYWSAICVTRYATDMVRREQWRKVLDSEVRRWSAMACEQLISELQDVREYEVELDSKKY